MAKKVKYYFDTESWAYRKIKPILAKKVSFIGLFVFASTLFCLLCFVAILNLSFLASPKDRLPAYESMKISYLKGGAIIGYVGSTEQRDAPHLHHEVNNDGKVVNPLNFYYGSISTAQYVVISKMTNQKNQSLD